MNKGYMMRVDSKTTPPPTDPPTDDDIERAIDLIMAESIRRAVRVQQLEAALDALLSAIDNKGRGLVEAVEMARKVRRGEEAKENPR